MDEIPAIGEHVGVEEAMKMIAIAVETMEPDGQLAERWNELKDMILGWATRNGEQITPEQLQGLRLQMEGMCGDTEVGEMLVATAKLGMSAIILAVPNIFCILLEDREPMHDDVGPLVEKGLNLLNRAKITEPFDPTVRIDYDLYDRLNLKKAAYQKQIEESSKRTWMEELIEQAVRPGAQN